MTTATLTRPVRNAIRQFQAIDPEGQLRVLWFLSQQLYRAAATTAPAACFSQRVQRLIDQLSQVPQSDRLMVLQEIVSGANTRLAEAYDALSANMRLAFWYRLANSLDFRGVPALSPAPGQTASEGLLADLSERDYNELVSFFETAVTLTGSAVSSLSGTPKFA